MRKRTSLILVFIALCVLAIGAGNAVRKAVDPSVAASGNPMYATLGKTLKGLVTSPPPPGAYARDPKLVAQGQTVYAMNCAACHGANLRGQPNWRVRKAGGTLPAPPHNVDGHSWHHNDQLLFDYTKHGGQAMAPDGFKSAMPAFRDALSDDNIRAVLSFIKSRWPADVQKRQRSLNR